MTFAEWVERHGPEALSALVRACRGEISRETVRRVRHGRPIALYQKAKLVSDLTGGQVTVEELTAGVPGWERRLKVKPMRRRRPRKRH